MFLRRTGFPEEDELVLCSVTKIQYHSVTCQLDEYNKYGMIHISEVSPGRIRNIRDYVQEGKKVVCKVLRINEEKGYIDLSLRRVNDAQRRLKSEEIKQEQKAEKIIEQLALDLKQDGRKLYEEIAPKIMGEYGYLHKAFIDIVENDARLDDIIGKEIGSKLVLLVKEKIQPKQVKISANVKLICFKEDGITQVKDALKKAQNVSKQISLKYRGAGTWHLEIIAKEYKEAEKILKEASEKIEQINSKEGEAQIERVK